MALLKLGPAVSGISGSIGGTTFARNRYGAYARARTKPVNPNSPRQQLVRSAMSACRALWFVTATAVQRTGWALYAQNVSMVNKLGETVNLSGYNQFCRSTAAALNASKAPVLVPPTTFSLAETDSTLACEGDVSDQTVKVTFDNTKPWANEAGGSLLIYQGAPQDKTRNFFNGPWRYIGKVNGAVTPAPTSPASIPAGFAVNLNNRCDIKARILRADGRLSNFFRVSGSTIA